jgi:hypothetical protein
MSDQAFFTLGKDADLDILIMKSQSGVLRSRNGGESPAIP